MQTTKSGYAVIVRGGKPTIYTQLHSVEYWRRSYQTLIDNGINDGSIDPVGNILSAGDVSGNYPPDTPIKTEKSFAYLIDNPQTVAFEHCYDTLHPEKARERRKKEMRRAAQRAVDVAERAVRDDNAEIQTEARRRMREHPYVFDTPEMTAEKKAREARLAKHEAELAERQSELRAFD
jgi:hypothetical protein